MGGIAGLVAAAFGVIWMIFAASIGAPVPFVLFGLLFIAMALGGAAYNFYNAGARNRMSTFDITSARDESDPIADALGHTSVRRGRDDSPRQTPGAFCPYCGAEVQAHFNYCARCGKNI